MCALASPQAVERIAPDRSERTHVGEPYPTERVNDEAGQMAGE